MLNLPNEVNSKIFELCDDAQMSLVCKQFAHETLWTQKHLSKYLSRCFTTTKPESKEIYSRIEDVIELFHRHEISLRIEDIFELIHRHEISLQVPFTITGRNLTLLPEWVRKQNDANFLIDLTLETIDDRSCANDAQHASILSLVRSVQLKETCLLQFHGKNAIGEILDKTSKIEELSISGEPGRKSLIHDSDSISKLTLQKPLTSLRVLRVEGVDCLVDYIAERNFFKSLPCLEKLYLSQVKFLPFREKLPLPSIKELHIYNSAMGDSSMYAAMHYTRIICCVPAERLFFSQIRNIQDWLKLAHAHPQQPQESVKEIHISETDLREETGLAYTVPFVNEENLVESLKPSFPNLETITLRK